MHGRVPCYGRGVCLVIQKNYSSGDKAPAAKEILLTSDVYRTVQSVFSALSQGLEDEILESSMGVRLIQQLPTAHAG